MKTKKKVQAKKKTLTSKKTQTKRKSKKAEFVGAVGALSRIAKDLNNIQVLVAKTCTMALADFGCPVAVLGVDEEAFKCAMEQIEKYEAANKLRNAKLNQELN